MPDTCDAEHSCVPVSHLDDRLNQEEHCKHTVQDLQGLLQRAIGVQRGHVHCKGSAAGKDEHKNGVLKAVVAQDAVAQQPHGVVWAKDPAGAASQRFGRFASGCMLLAAAAVQPWGCRRMV
jgi:hypothetical protein